MRGRREGREMGRRGGEMRKRIVIGGMVIWLLMGCNNGIADELTAEKRLGEIGRSAEKAFYSFMDLIADKLGFRVTKDVNTKKSEVAGYFNSLGETLGKVSNELEEVANKAETGDDKSDSSKNLIREAVNTAKITLNTLKTHLESLKEIGDDSKVGEIGGTSKRGEAVNTGELKKAYDALKGIVTTAKKEGVKELKGSTLNLAQASIGGANPKDGAKVLATDTANPAAGDSGKAALIVSAVSGEEILDAIVNKSKEGDPAVGTNNPTETTTAISFAKGGNATTLANNANPKAAAVAGGIALRSLIKEGKLASENGNDDEKAAQGSGITAVNKLLIAVEDIIKKTVKNVLVTVKQKIDEARTSKAVGQK